MLQRKIPIMFAIPALLLAVAGFFLIDDRTATAATAPKVRIWTKEACLQCHTDRATLKKMQDKAGDATFCQAAYNQLTRSESYTAPPK